MPSDAAIVAAAACRVTPSHAELAEPAVDLVDHRTADVGADVVDRAPTHAPVDLQPDGLDHVLGGAQVAAQQVGQADRPGVVRLIGRRQGIGGHDGGAVEQGGKGVHLTRSRRTSPTAG